MQLFHRGVALDILDKIFENPRIHTGTGYQLRENMVWKPLETTSGFAGHVDGEPERDLARFWRYICYTTGLCGETETENVVRFCNLWSYLEFTEGADCFQMINRRSGAGCSLINCLLKVTRDYHGAQGVLKYESSFDEDKDVVDIESASTCLCIDGEKFQRRFETNINQARHVLVALEQEVRREVIIGFIGRANVGSQLVGYDGGLMGKRRCHQSSQRIQLAVLSKEVSLCPRHGVC